MSDPVEVNVGECRCPGTPHPDGDAVYLRPKLGLAAGIAIQKLILDANSIGERLGAAELTGVLAEGYLLHGVQAWTFVDASGRPVPVTSETIRERLLNDFELGAPIADKADELYMEAVLLPLVKRAQSSSPTTPTTGSTSARPAQKRPRRSKPSSTTTTTTGVTATISQLPDGGSKSSQSSASEAA